ncbi:DUF6452 family protein [Tamlana sp. 62-3]|uniref:DUF6452 family protein n=1 Tax=Neotamlana sargassicola TaxID=2883125 RepID=A0A9X1I5N2_9FLAO|nr:DUF6452 family protein [Tamlana sargassicola]MCB4808277.1 DUF6452 family protein [Tamlana sargassicola]
MKKTIFFIILIVALAISCEKDDICAEDTSTTPRLVIDLYDASSPEDLEYAYDILIYGIGSGADSVLTDYEIADVNQLVLPLKTDESPTQFVLISDAYLDDNGTEDDDSDDFYDGSNRDTITVGYVLSEEYVSRACGYRTIYTNITLTIESDDDNWLLSRTPLTDDQIIDDEDEAHFSITH